MTTNKQRIDTNKNLVEPKLSYKIIGVLFDVHNELGPTLLEKYYQKAVSKGFEEAKLKFSEQVPINLLYKKELIGRYMLDFVIKDKIVLEIKAKPTEPNNFFQQVLSYLREANLPLAIIANFRSEKLDYRRVVNPDFIQEHSLDIRVHSGI